MAKDLPNLVGRGRRGHVVVHGRAAQQLVADAAAGPEGFETSIAKPGDHGQGQVAGGGRVGSGNGHGEGAFSLTEGSFGR